MAPGSALSFGAFAAGPGGTITVHPNGGRSKSGGLFLVTQGGPSAAAQFTVSGTANATYAITLPADGMVVLSNGGHTMALSSFTSSSGGSGTLSPGGTQTLSVGATLAVGQTQAPGSYTGAFAVTVYYN